MKEWDNKLNRLRMKLCKMKLKTKKQNRMKLR